MAYTKNQDPWADSDLVTTTVMDNFETIYTEASSYLSTHTHDDLYPTKTELESTYWYAGNDGGSSGADADLIYKSTGNLHASSFAGLGVPVGLVILWYGAAGAIPSGWHLCDGTAGTIDLRNRFALGAGGAYSPGDTGGAVTFTVTGTITISNHTLTIAEMAEHTHNYTERGVTLSSDYYTGLGSTTLCGIDSGTGTSSSSGSGDGHGHSEAEGTAFTGNAVACLPFYYALCYIQKI